MSHADGPASSLALLNAAEREILRLLTAGHTAKSIAARLGRSEAAINERLREARRKTGVGSSRELARMLAAQKTGDENIDLPPAGVGAEAGSQPPATGRGASQGRIVMLVALPIVALGWALAATQSAPESVQPAALSARAHASPLVGRWSLDVARIPAEERPRRVIMDFRVSPDRRWSVKVDVVAPDGSAQSGWVEGVAEDTPAPMGGTMTFADTVVLRQPAPGTFVMTFRKNGAPVSTRVYTVEKGGRTMKETIVWAGDSTPPIVTTWFNRIG